MTIGQCAPVDYFIPLATLQDSGPLTSGYQTSTASMSFEQHDELSFNAPVSPEQALTETIAYEQQQETGDRQGVSS